MKILVVIPTFNESATIVALMQEIFSVINTEILVVDDNSPDGTGPLVDEYSKKDSRAHCLHRSEKKGLGSAYREGFKWALERGYDRIVQMDADFSHDPKYLNDMMRYGDQFDLVIGSRYVKEGRIRNWKRLRKLTSWAGNAYALVVLHLRDGRYGIRDSTSGFKLWHTDLLRGMQVSDLTADGYAFQIALHWYAVQHEGRIKEIPIVFEDRKAGASKIGGIRVLAEALFSPFYLKKEKCAH